MSNLSPRVVEECPCSIHQNVIRLILSPTDKDLGGFIVRRALPVQQCRSIGPWVFFDHMGPAHFAKGKGIDVRPHPHIGLATVTYLFSGEMLHRDSLGSYQKITPGDVNLMVAGKGIVHSERQRDEIKAGPHTLNGLQLWLALPQEDEECEPEFHHYGKESIPQVHPDGVAVTVLMGTAYGVRSPVKIHSDTLYIEAKLNPGQSLTLPQSPERALYVVEGEISIDETLVRAHTMAILAPDTRVTINAAEPALVAMIGGESVGPRFMQWNFVASNMALIEKAKTDWQARRFAVVPGDEAEFIPLPNA
ncbi:pirin family protein [Alteromonas aestuariivivens]|uniref:Pirin family protein n=1 Tax=Alteromonas aestuariivivens TaxID=1938339 RepID=A0A3D8M394_9ALTE|nr:pirin family protein [Alteromonas aestuariivivens]RDV24111.1 pirin family protein [Alteromonas aestuariivivens]